MGISIKHIIVTLLCLFLVNLALTSARAQSVAEIDLLSADSSLNDLELEQDVEAMESFGEDAARIQAKQETARVKSEKKALEKDIAQMRKQTERTKIQNQKLKQTYAKKEKQVRLKKVEAQQAEARLNSQKVANARLEAQVKASQQKLLQQIERRKAAENALQLAKRENVILERKKQHLIAQQEREKQRELRARAQQKSMSQKNQKLKKDIARL